MFTRKDQLQNKGGPEERRSYLKKLKEEFEVSKSYESKKQILANLSNFAYDPINYEFLKEIQIIDLFLAQLSENSEELIQYSIAGLCNICIDPENREYIIISNGVHLISEILAHRNEEIAVNALTTLIYLFTPENNHLLTKPDLINKVLRYQHHRNIRLKNLANIFIEDFCTSQQVALASSTEYIPLPK